MRPEATRSAAVRSRKDITCTVNPSPSTIELSAFKCFTSERTEGFVGITTGGTSTNPTSSLPTTSSSLSGIGLGASIANLSSASDIPNKASSSDD